MLSMHQWICSYFKTIATFVLKKIDQNRIICWNIFLFVMVRMLINVCNICLLKGSFTCIILFKRKENIHLAPVNQCLSNVVFLCDSFID